MTSDTLTAYYFDRAITRLGTTIDADLNERTADAKSGKEAAGIVRRRLALWFSDNSIQDAGPVSKTDMSRGFKDPAAKKE